MPTSTNSSAEYFVPQAVGPCIQVFPVLPVALPASIAAAASWQSGIINGDGFPKIVCGVTLSQAGTLSIQRYIDQAGLVPVGVPTSVTLVAGTSNAVTITDGIPFGSFQVTIANTGGAAATPSAFALLVNAA